MRAAVPQPNFVLGAKPSCWPTFAVVCAVAPLLSACMLLPSVLQVEAREKAGKKQKKAAKAGSTATQHSNHNSEALPGGKEQQQQHQGSPSKQPGGDSHAGPAGHSSSAAEGEAAPQHGRSSSSSTPAGRQIVLSDPAAAFVLVATQEYVRVYSVGHAVAADRTTMRKVTMNGRLQFASAFMACGAPALACLLDVDGEIHLQVGV